RRAFNRYAPRSAGSGNAYVRDVRSFVRVLEQEGEDLAAACAAQDASRLCRRVHGRAVDAHDAMSDADPLALCGAGWCNVRDHDAAGPGIAQLPGQLRIEVREHQAQHRLTLTARLAGRRGSDDRRLHQLDIQLALRAVADDAEANGFARRVTRDESLQLSHAQCRLAVDLDDDVAALQPRASRGRIAGKVLYEHA